jgi:nicotinamidase-related amidase
VPYRNSTILLFLELGKKSDLVAQDLVGEYFTSLPGKRHSHCVMLVWEGNLRMSANVNHSSRQASTALLIVDLLSDFEFKDGDTLFARVKPVTPRIQDLKQRAKASGMPVIYVNDEIEKGGVGRDEALTRLRGRSGKADHILARLEPEPGDHLIFKPQRSGFFATGLGNLLLSLDISSVIVTGVTTDICVFFTAHDAYMRGYSVQVPSDCCAAVCDSYHEDALAFISRVAEADTTPMGQLAVVSPSTGESAEVFPRPAELRSLPSTA